MVDVRLPDGRVARFPDTMPREEIRAIIQDKFPDQSAPQTEMQAAPVAEIPVEGGNWLANTAGRLGQAAGSTFSGLTQGATLGAYDELAALLGTPVKAAENLMLGQDQINGLGDVGGFLGRSFGGALEGQRNLTDQAFEQAPAAFIAGDLAGSLAAGGGMAARGITSFGNIARPTIMGMAGRGAVEGGMTGFGSGYNSSNSDDVIDRLSAGGAGGIAGALLGGATGGVLGGAAGKAQAAAIPTAQALKSSAGDIYEGFRQSGARISASDYDGLANNIERLAASQNVKLPNGKTNPTYSALSGPLEVLDAYKGRGDVSLDELLAIRTNIRDAAADPTPGVSRIGMQMLDDYNDYLYKVAPDLKEADDLYWRGKTGELIDKMGELATSRSGQYSQSGMENALRAEFRLLERQIIKGRVKGIPTELKEQISKVAQGDSVQDFARWVSKFGVQNPLTSSTGVLAGLSTGSVIPTLGIWGGAQGAGAIARALAFEKYRGASALARSGGNMPEWAFSPVSGALVQGAGSQAGQAIGSQRD